MSTDEPAPGQASRPAELSDASENDVDTIAVIVVEVRDTAGTASMIEIEDMLRQRLAKTSVQIDDSGIRDLARQIREGD